MKFGHSFSFCSKINVILLVAEALLIELYHLAPIGMNSCEKARDVNLVVFLFRKNLLYLYAALVCLVRISNGSKF